MHTPESDLKNEMQKILWDFEMQTDHLILTRRTDQMIINEKKKEEKRKKRELVVKRILSQIENQRKWKGRRILEPCQQLWKMPVMMIPIVDNALRTVTKVLEKGSKQLEIGGENETIQTTALLKLAWILTRDQETWGDLMSFRLLWKPNNKGCCKNKSNNNNNKKKNEQKKTTKKKPKQTVSKISDKVIKFIAQSSGAVEYTDCTSAEG